MAVLYGKNYGKPTLDLNFAGNKSLVDTTTEKNYVTFSRAQSGNEATYIGSDGLIKYAAADEARFDHDPATGESLGLLIEEARTNFNPNSAATYNGGANVTANSALAPDGTFTAAALQPPASSNPGGTHELYAVFASVGTVNVGNTVTVYARRNPGSAMKYLILRLFTSGWYNFYNLETGQVVVNNPDMPGSMTSVGNGWWRCQLTNNTSAGATSSLRTFVSTVPSIAPQTNGDPVYLWGVQNEAGSFPTSYIPTSASAVTRAADVADITGTDFSNFYNNTEGTWFTDMALGYTQNAGNPFIFGGVYYTTVAGGAVRTLANTPTIMGGLSNSQTIPSKTAVALKSQDFAVYRDGTLTGSNNSLVYTPTGTQWRINSSLGSLGRIKRVTYWPKRLPDIELQQLTK